MRAAFTILFLMLIGLPDLARSEPPGISPSAAATDRTEASWADWEAQARIADGDYDGAVQAAKQAEAKRDMANRREIAVSAAKRP